MTPTEIMFAVISAATTVVSLAMTAINGWQRLQTKNEVLQLRVYVADHYVSKDTLDKVVARLETLLDRLEQRMSTR